MNAALLVDARQRYGVEPARPTRGDNHWQAKDAQGFAARDFVVDFTQQQATCPVGQTSNSWVVKSTHSGKPVILGVVRNGRLPALRGAREVHRLDAAAAHDQHPP